MQVSTIELPRAYTPQLISIFYDEVFIEFVIDSIVHAIQESTSRVSRACCDRVLREMPMCSRARDKDGTSEASLGIAPSHRTQVE